MLTTATEFRTKIAKALGQLPPFSPVLNKLLASLAKDDVSFTELAALIEKDTVMSGNVLRLVNSAAFARRGQINSIPHSISVLGLAKLRNLVLGLSISRIWAGVKIPGGWSQKNFNLHSVATAVLADHVAQHTSTNYPEGAFVGGLMHDFGRLLIALGLPDEYAEVQELFGLGGRTLSECEMEIVGADHGTITAIALQEWNLPEPIRIAAEYHHRPAANPNYEAEKDGAAFHLAEVILAADESVNRLGNSIIPRSASQPPEEAPFDPILPLIDPSILEKLREDYRREYEAIRAFF